MINAVGLPPTEIEIDERARSSGSATREGSVTWS